MIHETGPRGLTELKYYAALGMMLLPGAHTKADNWDVDGANGTLYVRGDPVRVEPSLADCLRSPSGSRDVRTGGLTWADNQPVVTVSFNAPRDTDNPQLLKAQGVSGLGLRLESAQGEDVRLGSRGKLLLLTPGQDTLNYTVTPECTSAPLMAGSYRAVVDIHLSYD